MYNTDTDNCCNSHCIRELSRQQEMFLKPIYLDLYDDPPDRSTMHEWSTGGQVMADNGQYQYPTSTDDDWWFYPPAWKYNSYGVYLQHQCN